MTSEFRLEWVREGRREIDTADARITRDLGRLMPGWKRVEVELAQAEYGARMSVDGVLRASAGAAVRTIVSPVQTYEEVGEAFLDEGDGRWVIGAGLRAEVDALQWEHLAEMVDHMRLLLGYELGCDGVIVAVPYSGWPTVREGGERHYLQMVDFGSHRDPALELYLSRGFWFAGRAAAGRVAYLAREL